jgi:hypothetical protein
MYSGGHTGKISRVDLSNSRFIEEWLPEETTRGFTAAAGFTFKCPCVEVPADRDPGYRR